MVLPNKWWGPKRWKTSHQDFYDGNTLWIWQKQILWLLKVSSTRFHSGVPGRVSFSHGRALCRKVAHCVIASKHRRLFSYSSIKHEACHFGAGITEHFTEKLCETTSKSVLKVSQPVCRCSKKKTPNQFGSDLAPRLTYPSSQHTLILSSPPMKRTDASKLHVVIISWVQLVDCAYGKPDIF